LNLNVKQTSSQKYIGFTSNTERLSDNFFPLERKRSQTHLPILVDDELRASPCEEGPSRSYIFDEYSGIKSTRKHSEIDIIQ